MIAELLNKVSGQEQDWHRVIDRLSTEMDCKVNQSSDGRVATVTQTC